ncbi:hypothetical protein [Kineococcus radiotolerans]|uniref:hypothetical protein n=1 Tax=Kineococcus radiotolerans TaxID=131568 RepID=UPI00003A3E1C|nr:hypothetical protein [Kineococcus radiotolerans]
MSSKTQDAVQDAVQDAADLITVVPGTPSETVQRAAATAQKRTFAELVESLLTTVGPRLTAAGAGLQDARQLAGWRKGAEPRQEMARDRVTALAEVVGAITTHYSAAVAASFLRSSQPALDDRAPVVMIRETTAETLPEVMGEVRSAVRAFLEG